MRQTEREGRRGRKCRQRDDRNAKLKRSKEKERGKAETKKKECKEEKK